MKAVTADMFHTVRTALIRHINANGSVRAHRPVPGTFGEEFLTFANQNLTENGIDCAASIVTRNGRPHILVNEEADLWEGSNTLNIGGADGIDNPGLRRTVISFLSAYIGNNPFTSFMDSVWGCLFEEVLKEVPDAESGRTEEESQVLRTYGDDIRGNTATCDRLATLLREIRNTNKPTREELSALLDRVETTSSRERALLLTLRSGIPYAFEKRWDDDDFDNCNDAYASVCVSPWDYFCVNYTNSDPFVIGIELTNVIWDGDVYFSPPFVPSLLLDDGTLEDVYDRKGFSAFCIELTNKLNLFNHA